MLFTKPVKNDGEKFFGQTASGEYYLIQDTFASFFEKTWKETDLNSASSLKKFVQTVLDNPLIFDDKLKSIPLFIESVANQLLIYCY